MAENKKIDIELYSPGTLNFFRTQTKNEKRFTTKLKEEAQRIGINAIKNKLEITGESSGDPSSSGTGANLTIGGLKKLVSVSFKKMYNTKDPSLAEKNLVIKVRRGGILGISGKELPNDSFVISHADKETNNLKVNVLQKKPSGTLEIRYEYPGKDKLELLGDNNSKTLLNLSKPVKMPNKKMTVLQAKNTSFKLLKKDDRDFATVYTQDKFKTASVALVMGNGSIVPLTDGTKDVNKRNVPTFNPEKSFLLVTDKKYKPDGSDIISEEDLKQADERVIQDKTKDSIFDIFKKKPSPKTQIASQIGKPEPKPIDPNTTGSHTENKDKSKTDPIKDPIKDPGEHHSDDETSTEGSTTDVEEKDYISEEAADLVSADIKTYKDLKNVLKILGLEFELNLIDIPDTEIINTENLNLESKKIMFKISRLLTSEISRICGFIGKLKFSYKFGVDEFNGSSSFIENPAIKIFSTKDPTGVIRGKFGIGTTKDTTKGQFYLGDLTEKTYDIKKLDESEGDESKNYDYIDRKYHDLAINSINIKTYEELKNITELLGQEFPFKLDGIELSDKIEIKNLTDQSATSLKQLADVLVNEVENINGFLGIDTKVNFIMDDYAIGGKTSFNKNPSVPYNKFDENLSKDQIMRGTYGTRFTKPEAEKAVFDISSLKDKILVKDKTKDETKVDESADYISEQIAEYVNFHIKIKTWDNFRELIDTLKIPAVVRPYELPNDDINFNILSNDAREHVDQMINEVVNVLGTVCGFLGTLHKHNFEIGNKTYNFNKITNFNPPLKLLVKENDITNKKRGYLGNDYTPEDKPNITYDTFNSTMVLDKKSDDEEPYVSKYKSHEVLALHSAMTLDDKGSGPSDTDDKGKGPAIAVTSDTSMLKFISNKAYAYTCYDIKITTWSVFQDLLDNLKIGVTFKKLNLPDDNIDFSILSNNSHKIVDEIINEVKMSLGVICGFVGTLPTCKASIGGIDLNYKRNSEFNPNPLILQSEDNKYSRGCLKGACTPEDKPTMQYEHLNNEVVLEPRKDGEEPYKPEDDKSAASGAAAKAPDKSAADVTGGAATGPDKTSDKAPYIPKFTADGPVFEVIEGVTDKQHPVADIACSKKIPIEAYDFLPEDICKKVVDGILINNKADLVNIAKTFDMRQAHIDSVQNEKDDSPITNINLKPLYNLVAEEAKRIASFLGLTLVEFKSNDNQWFLSLSNPSTNDPICVTSTDDGKVRPRGYNNYENCTLPKINTNAVQILDQKINKLKFYNFVSQKEEFIKAQTIIRNKGLQFHSNLTQSTKDLDELAIEYLKTKIIKINFNQVIENKIKIVDKNSSKRPCGMILTNDNLQKNHIIGINFVNNNFNGVCLNSPKRAKIEAGTSGGEFTFFESSSDQFNAYEFKTFLTDQGNIPHVIYSTKIPYDSIFTLIKDINFVYEIINRKSSPIYWLYNENLKGFSEIVQYMKQYKN